MPVADPVPVTAPRPLAVRLVAAPRPKPVIVATKPIPKPVAKPKPVKPKPVEKIKIKAPRPKSISPPPAPPPPPLEATPVAVEINVAATEAFPVVEEPAPAPPLIPPQFDAAYLQNPAPDYPRVARRLGEQGTVLLRVHVDPGGAAAEVAIKASSGSMRLDSSALAAVKRWRFVPAKQGNAAVSAWVIVPIVFSLES